MKRYIWMLALILILALTLVACKTTPDNTTPPATQPAETNTDDIQDQPTDAPTDETPTDAPTDAPADGEEQSLADIMAMLTTGLEDFGLVETEITAENIGYYFFIEPVDGAMGLASEPMINASAHSVCLLRVPEGTDVEALAKEIEEKADPYKWICVGAEKKVVLTHGNLICLIMSNTETATQVESNFNDNVK